MGNRDKSQVDMVPRSQVDAMVRSRIAEIMGAAGVDHGRVGVEVLYKLPPALVQVYELLWDLALIGEDSEVDRVAAEVEVGVEKDPKNRGGGAGGRTVDSDRSRERMGEVVVRSGGSSRRGMRGASRGSHGRVGGVGNAEASEIKSRADKRLRAVARDIERELAELGLGADWDGSGERMVRVRTNHYAPGRVEGGRGTTVIGDAIDDAIASTKK